MTAASSGLVLVLNSGSSSIKFQLVDPAAGTAVLSGLVEQIGEPGGPVTDHGAGLRLIHRQLEDSGIDLAAVAAVGHRVVHGGELFHAPTLITDEVVREIAWLAELAPLHNPANVIGIEVARKDFPDVPHVAVFDTGSSTRCRRRPPGMPSTATSRPATASGAMDFTARPTNTWPVRWRPCSDGNRAG